MVTAVKMYQTTAEECVKQWQFLFPQRRAAIVSDAVVSRQEKPVVSGDNCLNFNIKLRDVAMTYFKFWGAVPTFAHLETPIPITQDDMNSGDLQDTWDGVRLCEVGRWASQASRSWPCAWGPSWSSSIRCLACRATPSSMVSQRVRATCIMPAPKLFSIAVMLPTRPVLIST